MRKPLVPVFCAFLLAIPAADTQAQGRTTDLILGAGGTMSFATDEEATESRVGLNASAGFSLRVTEMVGLRIEGGFIQKGGGSEVSDDDAAGQVNIEVDYGVLRGLLEIGGDLHILAGATVGRDLGCDVAIDVAVEGVDLSTDQTCDALGLDRNDDFGITAGVGYNVGILGVTLLFTEGLNDIFADAGENAPAGRNRTLSLVGSIRIPLSG
ncbi:MAG: PorT family protein [Gemmatimonadetes bacterium]|nr:hypothetical protein [Gemmatimonadota bacterium]MYA40722.1 PorT family protein [Gemmatimonadota bacterium]MYE93501.1 PorT family protein [Gemmatimonadota bacterium]MYJ08814.1 PorT family protein [Gemmatimonadota bacterium]